MLGLFPVAGGPVSGFFAMPAFGAVVEPPAVYEIVGARAGYRAPDASRPAGLSMRRSNVQDQGIRR